MNKVFTNKYNNEKPKLMFVLNVHMFPFTLRSEVEVVILRSLVGLLETLVA